ncbi:hypothetical protein BS78_06G020900 [Paspalum vaginatum]|nr:hypothetical protein BS78_06G020900 [Paspalum vaginatum]
MRWLDPVRAAPLLLPLLHLLTHCLLRTWPLLQRGSSEVQPPYAYWCLLLRFTRRLLLPGHEWISSSSTLAKAACDGSGLLL